MKKSLIQFKIRETALEIIVQVEGKKMTVGGGYKDNVEKNEG